MTPPAQASGMAGEQPMGQVWEWIEAAEVGMAVGQAVGLASVGVARQAVVRGMGRRRAQVLEHLPLHTVVQTERRLSPPVAGVHLQAMAIRWGLARTHFEELEKDLR